MLTKDKALESACTEAWKLSKGGGSWGDTDIFEEIGGGATRVVDCVNEGFGAEGIEDLMELGAKLQAAEGQHFLNNVDLDLVVIFEGDLEVLLGRAGEVVRRFGG